eukprot:TRINITY_DN72194_c0_g1_i1.p1 TRINITY_DN72194_c0_g1~~TRINITY_DN72194_c0_g1_i1.p1  ORF type:complete len:274 (+),score=36.56 TRINITY_DN72194_c0_g1_i1:53-874(+)
MWGLREMTNHYGFFAGTRSDFLIVGHPEYQKGKVGADHGIGEGWSGRGPMKRAHSATAAKLQASAKLRLSQSLSKASLDLDGDNTLAGLRRSLSTPTLQEQIRDCTDGQGKLPMLSTMSTLHSPKNSGRAAPGSDLDKFLATLTQPDALPVYSREHRSDAVTRHYQETRASLARLREKAIHDPEGTRQALAKSGGQWRHYAQSLDQMGTRRIWNEELTDGAVQHGRAAPGVGKFRYTIPDSAMAYMEAPLYGASPKTLPAAKKMVGSFYDRPP